MNDIKNPCYDPYMNNAETQKCLIDYNGPEGGISQHLCSAHNSCEIPAGMPHDNGIPQWSDVYNGITGPNTLSNWQWNLREKMMYCGQADCAVNPKIILRNKLDSPLLNFSGRTIKKGDTDFVENDAQWICTTKSATSCDQIILEGVESLGVNECSIRGAMFGLKCKPTIYNCTPGAVCERPERKCVAAASCSEVAFSTTMSFRNDKPLFMHYMPWMYQNDGVHSFSNTRVDVYNDNNQRGLRFCQALGCEASVCDTANEYANICHCSGE